MSIYRNTVWFLKGLKEYTKGGYQTASKAFNTADLEVSCEGRSYMITGANSGIGKETAFEIAKRGGTVHMVCRSAERGEAAKTEIVNEAKNNDVHLHLLDMCKPKDVSKFAKEFIDSGKPLHVLINNAGCMVNKRELQDDGLEKNFATNTVGTHLLTVGLLSVLEKQQDPRVIIVSSGGMLVQKLDVSDLQSENLKPFEGTMVYAQNKRQQVVLTQEYSKKYKNIHFSSMHPGWSDTPAVQTAMPDFHSKMKNRLRSPQEGADTILWLAVTPTLSKHASGLFFQDRKPVATHLPLAWSKSTTQDEQKLMSVLADYETQFKAT